MLKYIAIDSMLRNHAKCIVSQCNVLSDTMENFLKKIHLTFFLLICFAQPVLGSDDLIFAIQPYLTNNEIQKRFDPLAQYLSKELEIPVRVRIGRDYQHHIDYIGRGMVDIAFIGPAPYVKLTALYGKQSLLARLETHGTPYYLGMIITRIDSPFGDIKSLEGKRFAFGDPNSTLSYLVPIYMLWENGITLEKLNGFSFLHSQNNVALGVLSGDYEAGAVKEEIFKKYASQGLKAIATSPKIPEHVFISRVDLPDKMKNAVKKALFKLKATPEGRKIMEGIKGPTTNITTVKDSDYDELRKMINKLREIGLTP